MSRELNEKCGSRVARKQLKVILGLAASVGLGAASYAHAQNVEPGEDAIDLFTTTSDFTGWGTGAKSTAVAPSTAYDWDLDTTNGLGNNPGNSGSSINPGGTSTGGALQITASANMGFSSLAFSSGQAYNDAFMHAVDPGSTTAFSAASGFGNGTTVPYSGTMLMTYSVPTFAPGGGGNGAGFYELGLILNYNGTFVFDFGSNGGVNDGTVGGFTTFTETIPYSITAQSLSYFTVGIAVNADGAATPTSPIYIDDVELVPEPATLGVLGAGVTLLTMRRRRNASV